MGGKLIVVSGAQLGSEAKGHTADQLTRPGRVGDEVVAVRVAGPNAGHVVYGACPEGCDQQTEHLFHGQWLGHPWKLRSVPVSAVSNPHADLVIAAGSEIDPAVLATELSQLDSAGYGASARVYIDEQATMLMPYHIEEEKADGITERLGSTSKGIGAARADRLWRKALLAKDYYGSAETVPTADLQHEALREGATVLIEGTQGYGLGLHAGAYPYCTSSNCRALDFLAMAGVSPWHLSVSEFEVWLTARVRPIRVAGNSGPLKGETTWAELGLPEEHTTVTGKVRRVGEWDGDLVRNAVVANGGSPTVRLSLTMVDTVFPKLAGLQDEWVGTADGEFGNRDVARYIEDIEREVGAQVEFVGTSPNTGIFIKR